MAPEGKRVQAAYEPNRNPPTERDARRIVPGPAIVMGLRAEEALIGRQIGAARSYVLAAILGTLEPPAYSTQSWTESPDSVRAAAIPPIKALSNADKGLATRNAAGA
jgi:hypothetical protein